jgi:osmotically-inducible protein OsmY
VSVVDGVVYLRGEVANLDEVQHLVDDALAVTGVRGVESMLHTPGTPAPTDGAG